MNFAIFFFESVPSCCFISFLSKESFFISGLYFSLFCALFLTDISFVECCGDELGLGLGLVRMEVEVEDRRWINVYLNQSLNAVKTN